MKKWLIRCGLGLTVFLFAAGCSCAGLRGQGDSFGIVVTIEDNKPAGGRDSWSAWVKSDETDSAPDCYMVKEDPALRAKITEFARNKTFARITFQRYGPWSTISKCSGDLIVAIDPA